ncbi:hypothetical protein Plhal304r1_c055g0140481 [Plasmopara halstedii]
MHYSTKTRSCAFILYSSQKMLFWSTRYYRMTVLHKCPHSTARCLYNCSPW